MVKVLLTGVFDPTVPTAIDRRIEYAFGVDGRDFWERFFLCNKVHPNDRVVYLFTEHQMWVLYDWWVTKYKTGTEYICRNLDFSRQVFFTAPVVKPKGRHIYYNRVNVCYVKRGINNRLEVSRVFFGVSPGVIEGNCIDFFEGRFKEGERRVELTELLAIRPMIEKEFGGPGKKDAKWLYYLGSGTSEKDYASIEYCRNINLCPFVENGAFSCPPLDKT